VAEAATEQELRERYARQGYLVYSVKPRGVLEAAPAGPPPRGKVNIEKFLIFNQQFVTLIKAGLPILKALDLLSERLTDAKLGPHIRAVRDNVKKGAMLSEAFEQQGLFPPIYVTSVMAGEKRQLAGGAGTLSSPTRNWRWRCARKSCCRCCTRRFWCCWSAGLVVFLVTYVVPSFAQLYQSDAGQLPRITKF
jgi:type IV pilus assembly protein PilC